MNFLTSHSGKSSGEDLSEEVSGPQEGENASNDAFAIVPLSYAVQSRFLESFRIEFIFKILPGIPESAKLDKNLWDEELYQTFIATVLLFIL